MRGPLRVLHVITRLELGGAQRNTLHTVAHLDRREFSPALAWGPGGILDREAESLEDVRLHPVPRLVRKIRPVSDAQALAALRRVMRRERPHIVHTHSSKAGILGRLAARLEGVPAIVHTVHGFGFTPLQPAPVRALFLALERLAARWTTHVVTVSRADYRRGVELGLFGPEEATVIRSGIRLGDYAAASGGDGIRRDLGIPGGAILVTQVGNFKPQKAPLDFVRMAVRVAAVLPQVHFLMTGEGPLRTRAETMAGEAGLAERFHFTGWRDDIPAVFDATDLAVLSSRHEGLPRAVVEALAAGVPVVATAVDGTPEVLRDGVDGYVVPPADVERLAERVLRLARDTGLRRGMGRAPRNLDEFDIDSMVRKQEDLYRWMISSTSS